MIRCKGGCDNQTYACQTLCICFSIPFVDAVHDPLLKQRTLVGILYLKAFMPRSFTKKKKEFI